MKNRDPNQLIELGFPLKGLSVNRSKSRQGPGTTPDCENVRAYDPKTDRNRGARRPGLRNWMANRAQPTTAPIQLLDHISCTTAQALPFGSGNLYVHAEGSWITYDNLGNQLSVSRPIDTASGFGNQDACFDQDGNLYVVFDDQSSPHDDPLRLKKFDRLGNQVWSISLDSSGGYSSSLGIVIHQGICYVGASVGSSDPNVQLYRVSALTGLQVGPAVWLTSAITVRIHGTSVGINTCMALSGNYIGIAGTDITSNTTQLIVISLVDGTVAESASFSSANDGGVADIAGDASGNFYVAWVSSSGTGGHREANYPGNQSANRLSKFDTTATLVAAFGTAGTVSAHTKVNSICYDPLNNVLFMAGSGVDGTTDSVAAINTTTGATASAGQPSSVAEWMCIRADGRGNFWISDETNRLHQISATYVVGLTLTTSGTSGHVLACADGAQLTYGASSSQRITRAIMVADGTVSGIDKDGEIAITSGTDGLNPSKPIIWSTQNGAFLYFADGVNYKRYVASTNTLGAWTASAGTMPGSTGLRPRLIETWRGRIVLTGLDSDPQNWFMSAVNDPLDWDLTTKETSAVTGNSANGTTGKASDIINCFVPFSDEVALLGGDHSIMRFRGDPMAGGRIDTISTSTGMAWGRPYCLDPNGIIYFFGSRPGVYRMQPQGLPESISESITDKLDDIDLSKRLVRMVWNELYGGFHLFLSHLDPTEDVVHFWYDARNGAWWQDHFEDLDHNALAVHTFDGDDPNDRAILFGGRDGYIRIFDAAALDDHGVAIKSRILLGPLQGKTGLGFILKDLQCTLAAGSGTVSWGVRVGDSVEVAETAAIQAKGTFKAGRNRSQAVRRFGHAAFVELSSVGSHWSFEQMMASILAQGQVRQRQF